MYRFPIVNLQLVAFSCSLLRDKLDGSETWPVMGMVAVSCVPRRDGLDGNGTVTGRIAERRDDGRNRSW
jgi:hypothetical protein